MATRLSCIPFLEFLDIGDNYFSDTGVQKLADNLHYVKRLKLLDLSSTNGVPEGAITDNGAIVLATALLDLPEIQSLSLRNHNVGERGAKALVTLIQELPNIQSVLVSGNIIPPSTVVDLQNLGLTALEGLALQYAPE